MKAYKVLRRTESGKLVSCIISGYLRTEYKTRKWAEPKVGMLLAFTNVHAAANFRSLHCWTTGEIWECEAVKGKEHKILHCVTVSHIQTPEETEAFLKHRSKYGRKRYPEGTIFCEKIKLIRKVAL